MALQDYKIALVTGASSGIGEAAVKALTQRGISVYAVARRQKKLEQLAAATGCTPLMLDLRDTQAIYQTLSDLDADILINNAGTGRGVDGLFKAKPQDIDITLQTNIQAAIHVLKAVVPGMIERKRGHVVNIGSVAGLYPINSAVYGGSKGAMHLLSQNLRLELRGSGVRVTEICPGRVGTEFFDASIDDSNTLNKVKDTGINELRSEDIAEAMMYVLNAPWRVNVSLLEIVPNEQTFGGLHFTPVQE
jgi:NADP-dependent 3-hydroxy acid dehydrogenase YdfG